MLGNRQGSFILFFRFSLDDDDDFCEPGIKQPVQKKLSCIPNLQCLSLNPPLLPCFNSNNFIHSKEYLVLIRNY